MKILIALLLIFFASTPAHADYGSGSTTIGLHSLPALVTQQLPDLKLQGQGDLNFLMFKVYRIGYFAPAPTWDLQHGFALAAVYETGFSNTSLVHSTISEMKNQVSRSTDNDYTKLNAWQEKLMTFFPTVKAGEQLTSVFIPPSKTEFYLGDVLIGEMDDAVFAERFFGIWLSAKTSEPRLRRQLLGEK